MSARRGSSTARAYVPSLNFKASNAVVAGSQTTRTFSNPQKHATNVVDVPTLEAKVAAWERELHRAMRNQRNRPSPKHDKAVKEAEKALHIASTQRMSAILEADLKEVERLRSKSNGVSFEELVDLILELNPHVKRKSLLRGAEFESEEPLWDLSDLDLVKLPKEFGEAPFKTHAGGKLSVDLSHNRLRTLPESIGNLNIHADLLLNNNKIERLPDTMHNLKEIPRNLNLGSNNLESLPPCFSDLKIVGDLDLSRNHFEHLPDDFCQIHIGRCLTLTSNSLLSLPADFGTISVGHELGLSRNRLEELPDSFRFLNLSGNLVRPLPASYSLITAPTKLQS